jgi:cytoskeletal protein RodZ
MRKLLFAIPAIGLIASGCASAQAKAPAERPPLTVPAPPARVIEPAPEAPEPVSELPPVLSPAAPRVSRPSSPKPEVKAGEPKPGEAKPADTPPPVDVPPPVSPTNPPEQLNTPQTVDTTGAAKAVQATLDRAKNALSTVNFGPLSNERKKAYNDAKLFMQQAEDALKQGNFVFAQGVASKAETLARELAGR